jgi:hypothetical protein
MSPQKWGESFLKSGLPLEHLTLTTLAALGWSCTPKWEYSRLNRDLKMSFFEIDLIASQYDNRVDRLTLLTECKYHDEQRFWFFLPCSTVDHQAQYGAMSAGHDLESDKYMLHYGPYIPLKHPKRHSLSKLAPLSVWGVTLSKSGDKQDNAIHNALEQLAYAFVPFCLDDVYSFCSSQVTAVIPTVVTTAKLFTLKPDIRTLEHVRDANAPHEVANEVPWTWCYYASRGALLDHNTFEIEHWQKKYEALRWRGLEDQLAYLWSGLHWVFIVNIHSLADAVTSLNRAFLALPKDFSRSRQLSAAVQADAKLLRKLDRQRKTPTQEA